MKIKTSELNSVALALLIFSGLVGYLFQYLGIATSFLTVNMLVVFVAVLLSIFYRFVKKSHKIKICELLFLAYLSIVVFWSIYIKESDYTLLKFFVYVLSGAIIVSGDINIELVLRMLTYSTIIFVPVYSKVFALTFVTLNQANMGTMYKVLNLVLAGIIHFFYFRKECSKKIWIGYAGSLILLVGLVTKANRGVVLSVVFAFAVCILNYTSSKSSYKTHNIKKRLKFIVILLLASVLVLNMNKIILGLYGLWSTVSQNVPSFLVKMNKYILLNDTSNGRTEVFDLAVSIIREHPLFGIGIENFGKYFEVNYPHNFILQLWLEGGVFFLIVPVITSVYLVKEVMMCVVGDKKLEATLIFMMLLAIPRFLLSLDIWTYYEFWIPIFYVVANYKYIQCNTRTVVGSTEKIGR